MGEEGSKEVEELADLGRNCPLVVVHGDFLRGDPLESFRAKGGEETTTLGI